MEEHGYQKSFVFQNATENLNSVLTSCLNYIGEKREMMPVPVTIHPKIKWTITELLLNGTKHAGTAESNLTLNLTAKKLIIKKEDSGSPLRLKVSEPSKELVWPLEDSLLRKEFEIYHNGMDSLRVFTENHDSAVFTVTELEDVAMPQLLVNTSEHFGLMIIAKASSNFTYVYDRRQKRNIFSVTFDYTE